MHMLVHTLSSAPNLYPTPYDTSPSVRQTYLHAILKALRCSATLERGPRLQRRPRRLRREALRLYVPGLRSRREYAGRGLYAKNCGWAWGAGGRVCGGGELSCNRTLCSIERRLVERKNAEQNAVF